MKIEPEVACAFTSFDGEGGGGGGCSPVDLGRSAQDHRPSIGESGRGPLLLFDCEHFQFIDDEDETPSEETEGGPSPLSMEPPKLRPALVRKGAARRQRGRVTFDEAVVLYSDENEGPRTLALTTGPDVIICCTEVFCMFEPPAEYRDVPPFEPPAEYRDSEEEPPPPQPPPAEEQATTDEPPAVELEPKQPDGDDVCEQQQVVAPPEPVKDTTKESDKLFERFLEAEREFAVDDELDSVFHALEDDFSTTDNKNGALDDTFFRKLIHLLSSAETPTDGNEPFSSSTHSEDDPDRETEEEDSSQAHSRTLSEADSDCSISSQDTIIVRLGEEQVPDRPADDTEVEVVPTKPVSVEEKHDEVFSECVEEEKPNPPPVVASQKSNNSVVVQAINKLEKGGEESLSRQSSGEQSVNSQDPPQDADDSTSSDSRSGEVEEEIRLDDIGYDEEDADDYDEESFRGMAHGNSKIRRIIKKNALQCTLLRGIEAKRRQQPGAKYPPRPKSPLLSQESLVEKLKWLTTIDEHKDQDLNFHSSKPPDVILSAGGVNGSIPSSEDDVSMRNYHQQHFYQQQRHVPQPGGYYGFPVAHHPSLPRQRSGGFSAPPVQMVQHTLPHRVPPARPQWPEQQQQRNNMTVPRNFRDWRVIQRVNVGRGGEVVPRPVAHVPADYVRCPPNGAYAPPPDVTAGVGRPPQQLQQDELEQFAEQDSRRTERIKKRYSVAEEDDDPTFGFARRPSVRGVQVAPHPPDSRPEPLFEDQRHSVYGGPDPARGWGSAYAPHLHRASVALTANATLPYAHRRPPQDPRYHSYAESVWGPNPWAPPPLRGDERGVPEGASSSPKVSSDSLYHHSAVPDSCGASGPSPRKEDGVIYYSLNV